MKKIKFVFDINIFLEFKISVVTYKAKGAKQCYNYQHFNNSSEDTLSPKSVSHVHRVTELKIVRLQIDPELSELIVVRIIR